VTQPAGSGLVVVDKPGAMTSHDVVARVRRLAGTRKVGHSGTLDPMATGVLLLGVNKATRLLGHLTLVDKRYDATVRLGQATVSDDAEGEVVSRASARHLTQSEVADAAAAFVGDILQVPSAVSAVKVQGQRAYRRVRDGETVDLPPRPVTVHELTVGSIRHVSDVVDVDIAVHCSSGTFVRAIARDLGAALGVGGHLTRLRRTAVGPVTLAEAQPLDDAEESGQLRIVGMAEAGRRFFPAVDVDGDVARAVSYGQHVHLDLPVSDAPVALLGPDGGLLALYADREGVAAAVAVFPA